MDEEFLPVPEAVTFSLTDRRKVFSGPVEFRYGVASLDMLPPGTHMPEIAFAGRSNVGKSSLINALLGRDIAHVSKTPGRTQQLNFFDIAQRFFLVDMPGYGYAKVSKEKRSDWDSLIFDYLRGRAELKTVLLLVDGRHGIKDVDKNMMEMLDDAAVNYRVILTKADECKAKDLEKTIAETKKKLAKQVAAYPEIYSVSAHEEEGLVKLHNMILEITR